MSRNLRILLLVALLAAAGGAGWYFLMGPGSGAAEDEPFDIGPPPAAATDCPPGGSAGTGDPAAGTVTPPAATPPAATPPAATPPAGDAPVTRGGHDDGTVVAAAAGSYDAGATTDSPVINAAEVDPAATATPPAGTATPPAAGTDAVTGAASGDQPQPQAVDPCADTTSASTPDPLAGTGAGGAGTAGTAAAAAGAAQSANSSDGANDGNNPEALATSQAVVAIGKKSKLSFAVDTTLVPAAGGVRAAPAKLRQYRGTVSAAVLRIRISDGVSQAEWNKGSKVVRTKFVAGFLTFLKRTYPKATRSVTIVTNDGRVLAVGDATGGAAGTVQIYG